MKTLIEIEYVMATELHTSPIHTDRMDFMEVRKLAELFNELHKKE